jgi:hypothetical protein
MVTHNIWVAIDDIIEAREEISAADRYYQRRRERRVKLPQLSRAPDPRKRDILFGEMWKNGEIAPMNPETIYYYFAPRRVKHIILHCVRYGETALLDRLLEERKLNVDQVREYMLTTKGGAWSKKSVQWLCEKKLYCCNWEEVGRIALAIILNFGDMDSLEYLIETFPEEDWKAFMEKHALAIQLRVESTRDIEQTSKLFDMYLQVLQPIDNGFVNFTTWPGDLVRHIIQNAKGNLIDILLKNGMSVYQILCTNCRREVECKAHTLGIYSPILAHCYRRWSGRKVWSASAGWRENLNASGKYGMHTANLRFAILEDQELCNIFVP